MPFYDNDALLPLPETPHARFCSGLSCYAKIVEDALELEDAKDMPLPLGEENFTFCATYFLFVLAEQRL